MTSVSNGCCRWTPRQRIRFVWTAPAIVRRRIAAVRRATELFSHYSLLELLQARDDVLLVAQRLLDFHDGGPRPTTDDAEFMTALDRMRDRLEQAPIAFDRRSVNVALRELAEAPL